MPTKTRIDGNANFLEAIAGLTVAQVAEEIADGLDLPDFDDFLDVGKNGDMESFIREHDLVQTDDLPNFEDYLKNDEVEEMIRTNDLVTEDDVQTKLENAVETYDQEYHQGNRDALDLMAQVSRRGFFGRLKWVFTGK